MIIHTWEGGGGGSSSLASSLRHTYHHHHLDVDRRDTSTRWDSVVPHVTDASSELIVGTPSKKSPAVTVTSAPYLSTYLIHEMAMSLRCLVRPGSVIRSPRTAARRQWSDTSAEGSRGLESAGGRKARKSYTVPDPSPVSRHLASSRTRVRPTELPCTQDHHILRRPENG